MRKLFFILPLVLFCANISAQNVTFFVIGDKVNIRSAPSLDSEKIHQAEWGTKYTGKRVNKDWYTFYTESTDEDGYLSSKHVVEEKEFYPLAEAKSDKNGRTKYELLLYYMSSKQDNKAEQMALELINLHRQEYFLLGHELCNFLDHMAYRVILAGEAGDINYKSERFNTFAKQVLNNGADSVIVAVVKIGQVKHQMQNGRLKDAENILFELLKYYSEYLFIPLPCDNNFEYKIAPLIDLKNLFFSLTKVGNWSDEQRINKKLETLRKETKIVKTKRIIKDLLDNRYAPFWDY